jgi:hypothetical protein
VQHVRRLSALYTLKCQVAAQNTHHHEQLIDVVPLQQHILLRHVHVDARHRQQGVNELLLAARKQVCAAQLPRVQVSQDAAPAAADGPDVLAAWQAIECSYCTARYSDFSGTSRIMMAACHREVMQESTSRCQVDATKAPDGGGVCLQNHLIAGFLRLKVQLEVRLHAVLKLLRSSGYAMVGRN